VANSSDEVLLHECRQHEQQTGGAGSHGMIESYDLTAITETSNPMAAVRLLLATGCSEGTDGEGVAEVLPSTSRNG